MDLATCAPDSPRLMVVPSAVAPDAFASLCVADLMVSLYNNGTVPCLMLVPGHGAMQPMQPLLQAASDWWAVTLGDTTGPQQD